MSTWAKMGAMGRVVAAGSRSKLVFLFRSRTMHDAMRSLPFSFGLSSRTDSSPVAEEGALLRSAGYYWSGLRGHNADYCRLTWPPIRNPT